MTAQRVRTSSALAFACAGPVVAVFAVGGVADAQDKPPGSSSGSAVVKYFVVPYSATPDENTLFRIAEQTLGSGSRYPEIFQLNQGSLRPDGTAFVNPASIQPGQVLRLPDDAHGARNGPPLAWPAPAPQAAPPPQPAQTITTTTGATSGSLVASLTTGIGGTLLGLLGGLRIRRAWMKRSTNGPSPAISPEPPTKPLLLPSSPPEPPVTDDEFEPSRGVLELPPSKAKHRLKETGPIRDWIPLPGAPGENTYFFLSAADTRLHAAVPSDIKIKLPVVAGPMPEPVIIDEEREPAVREISDK